MDSVEELLELLSLDSPEPGLYVGPPSHQQRPRVFGGQLIAQALAAASFTAPDDWPCHSLHAYFVRPSKPGRPIEYEVSRMRDGQRFATRKVIAVQRDEVNLELIASFAREEPGPEHQRAARDTPPPESFPAEEARVGALLRDEATTEGERALLQQKLPIEWIGVDRRPGPGAASAAPVRWWMRVRGTLPRDPRLHRCALAYASDMGPIEPCIRSVGLWLGAPDLQVASLDHALWFHRPFWFDDWLLFSFEPDSVSAGRGLARGYVYRRDGTLIASIAQEALMRQRDLEAAT